MKSKTLSSPFIKLIFNAASRLESRSQKFTWNRLALKLKISKSYLSQILSEKKPFPCDKLDLLIDSLDLDEMARHQLISSFLTEELKHLQHKSKALKNFLNVNPPLLKTNESNVNELNMESLNLFDQWYYTALLDLIETSTFKLDFNWISKKLKISKPLVELAWRFLRDKGYIEEVKPNQWRKSILKFRMADGETVRKNDRDLVRARWSYYSQMMEKGKSQILEGTAQKSRRLIQGLTCTVNPNTLPSEKIKLEKQLYQSAERLSSEEGSEVYFLMTMLIPLTTED